MKIIDIIQLNEVSFLGQLYRDTLSKSRDAGSWGLEQIGRLVGRGEVWRKAEMIAPEIVEIEKRSGRPLTREQIEKHIIESDPLVKNALEEAQRMKQAYIDHQYTVNPTAAKQRFGTAEPPVARLTTEETATILAKPEFKPKEKLVKEVESKVSEVMSQERRAAAMAAVAPVAKWTDRLVRYGIEGAIVAQVIAPFSEYYAKVEDAKKWYDSGQMPTTGVPASIKTLDQWYIWYIDRALGDAILKSGAIWIIAFRTRKILRWVGGIAKVFVGEKAGAYIGGLVGSAATAGILSWGFDKEMDKFWGSVFANLIDIPQLHIDLSRIVGSAITSRVNDTAQTWASNIMWGFDAIASKFRELTGLTNGADDFVNGGKEPSAGKTAAGQPETLPAAGKSTAPAAAGQLSPAEIEKRNADMQSGKNVEPSGKTVAPTASGQAVPAASSTVDKKAAQQGFIDLGGGWLEDPKTGKIYPKIQESR